VIPGKKYHPEDFLRVLLVRKWLFIVPLVTVALATALIVHFLPDRYRAVALVQVQAPRIPSDLIKSNPRGQLDGRLANMQSRILSRSRLESLIAEFNLYPEQRRSGELMEDITDRMLNQDIDIHVVRGNIFQVGFDSEERITALRVTAKLAQLFIDESFRDREVLTQGTSQFIESQLEETRQKLIDHERKLEEYRRLHSGELPSQMTSNLTGANNAQMQLQSINEGLNRDRDRLQVLEREQNDLASQTAPTALPVVVDGEGGGGTAAQQLEAARRQLRQMELRLKPEHPDVVRAKRIIADLEQKAEAESLQTPVSMAGASSPADKARQQRLAELRNSIETLRTQITRREHDAEAARDALSRYQARAEAAPTRETELIELNRDYDTLRALYADLLKKSQESQMAAALETRQIGEQFRLLEPARAQERPISPNRPQLNLIGVFGGLALGLGFVALAEYRDTTFKTEDDIMTSLALPVLAMIPNMVTRTERRIRRRRRVVLSVTAVLVALAAAVAATVAWFGWRA
jgi:polysaccharide chain length determinant protein (PEP-CTERM system associated)